MIKTYRQAVSGFLCVLLFHLPILGEPAGFIGVGKASGRAQINGLLALGEFNVFSGDRLSTEKDSFLLLFTAPGEKLRLAPESKAQLIKDGDTTVIALEQGAVALRTAGRTMVAIEKYGVTIRSQGRLPAVTQAALSNAWEARVWGLTGSVEVASANQSVLLQPGQLALISSGDSRTPELSGTAGGLSTGVQEAAEAEPGSITGTLVDETSTVVRGAQVSLISAEGVVFTTESNELGSFRFDRVPPGRYTLRVSKPGLPRFELPNVRVGPGQESTLGVITMRGGGGGNTGIIIGVLAAAVGGGLGAALALGGGDEQAPSPPPPVSPSIP